MENKYLILKKKQEAEVNEFPMAFAFSNEQFKEGMEKLGLTEHDTDKVYKLSGTGGFYRKTDAEAFRAMLDRHSKEMQDAIDADKDGEDFVVDMFSYELANHEFGYTWDDTDTLMALGLTKEKVNADKKLSHGLKIAKKKIN